jgi:long-chain acyl-CoA synthetase
MTCTGHRSPVPHEGALRMDAVWLKSYPPEVDPHPAIPEGSVAQLIRDCCRTYATSEAYWSMGRSITFGETYALATRVARWLTAQGVRPGDRVAIMLPNVLAFPVVTYGALLAGAVVVNVNPMYTPRELAHQLLDAGARTMFAWEPALVAVHRCADETGLERVVVVTPAALLGALDAPPKAASLDSREFFLESVLAAGSTGPEPDMPPPDPLRAVMLQYTGGTTGVSKGALLTERNVRAALAQQLAWTGPFMARVRHPHRRVVAMPLYHIAALMAGMYRALVDGSCSLLIADPRNIDGFVDTLASQRFTVMGGVNTLYNALANHPRIGTVDFSHCVFSGAGATATQQAVVDRWRAISGMSIVEGYGMTETCCYISQQALDGRPFDGSVGLPLPLTEISVRDSADQEVPLGEPGEVCIRGPQVMAAYWNRPDETARVMTTDGFLRTGDIGSVDSDGYLRLSERKKDMILVSGFNVFPTEIEGVLLKHPKVLEAAVIASPDEHSGEVPVAFVVRRDPSLDREELITFMADMLTAYKRPKRIEFRDSLPKSPVGKILRRVLRDEDQSGSAS